MSNAGRLRSEEANMLINNDFIAELKDWEVLMCCRSDFRMHRDSATSQADPRQKMSLYSRGSQNLRRALVPEGGVRFQGTR